MPDATAGPRPLLILACGNPSRGDDALGPLLVERIDAQALGAPWRNAVETLVDFQLQVEHALDLVGRRCVVFVDASCDGESPFAWSDVGARRDATYSTHAISPSAVLQAFVDIGERALPACRLLAVRGHAFELGEPLSAQASVNLDAAVAFLLRWIADAARSPPRDG